MLESINDIFNGLYFRPSIPPEHLLPASLLQVLYSIHAEHLQGEQLDYILFFRRFTSLYADARVWNHISFS
ncbi:transposase [Chromobacterium paludis]|uniref:transposase n=1 Tax=Chromobacterium paludis TaxID=2605945 RepID=UPI0038B2B321